MTWREKFEMGVGIYVAALGQEKPAMMRRDAIEAGFRLEIRDDVPDAYGPPMKRAYEFVQWKFGLGGKPAWAAL